MTDKETQKAVGKAIILLLILLLPASAHCESFNISEEGLIFSDKVVTVHRRPIKRSRVPENITVITAKEIEEMHAHSLAEVLERVPGVFVSTTKDFGSSSILTIQGSEQRHVLVTVDDMVWNFLSGGNSETNNIPVGIIERIEIVRGPASSAWGSALGGVINVVTKGVGYEPRTHGTLNASLGEKNTRDVNALVSGRYKNLGVFLYGGSRDSDGLINSRGFDSGSGFVKLRYGIDYGANFEVDLGHFDPSLDQGDFDAFGISSDFNNETSFIRAAFENRFAKGLNLDVSGYFLSRNPATSFSELADGDFFQAIDHEEETSGASGKLTYEGSNITWIVGADFRHGSFDQKTTSGPALQFGGIPELFETESSIDEWAIYSNATILFGNCSITPGIRFDHNSITGSFVSPSIGFTYQVGNYTVLRASVAQGFSSPALSLISGGGLFLDPNQGLDYEEISSYQFGIETGAVNFLRLKATVFYHDTQNANVRERFGGGAPSFNDIFVNNGSIYRKGLEFEVETLPVYNFSLMSDFSFVDISPGNDVGASDSYTLNAGIRYSDSKVGIRAQLTGHFVWWDFPEDIEADYEDFIWDFSISKKTSLSEAVSAEVFCKVHNLFSGSQDTDSGKENPNRWFEAGITIKI